MSHNIRKIEFMCVECTLKAQKEALTPEAAAQAGVFFENDAAAHVHEDENAGHHYIITYKDAG